MNSRPTLRDALIPSIFIVLITLQPYFLHHEIIMMETGIHLPAINALFKGGVPYKDFFFLRGPLELYVPAIMIWSGGFNSALLPVFFYLGNVATLIFCLFVGRHLLRSRIVLYLMIAVVVARTFPRVSYYYWGGMRYAIGFLALWLLILFFKQERKIWIFFAGLVSALAALTTVEAGISVFVASMSSMAFRYIFKIQKRQFVLRSAGIYATGMLILLVPYVIYLVLTDSLIPFIESIYVVVKYNRIVVPLAYGERPDGFLGFLSAFNPTSKFFKFMTPVFCYTAFFAYMFLRVRSKKANKLDCFLIGLAVYGLILYIAAFRKIQGHHFEMALQPEKLLLFFILEELLFHIKRIRAGIESGIKSFKNNDLIFAKIKIYGINFLVFAFIMSSIGYAVQRYNHRFPAFKLITKNIFKKDVKGLSLLEDVDTKTLDIKRAKGFVTPGWQANEITKVVEFIKKNTAPRETVFTFPELGNFNFWADRPFVGRFPIATFAWMYEPWWQELINDFKKTKPKYVIMTKVGHRTFPELMYFRNSDNKARFDYMTDLIKNNYEVHKIFNSVQIYKRKNK